jgi:hypothetical protein
MAILLVVIACFGIKSSRAQGISGLQNSFNNYQKTDLHEKLYVHVNKSFFLTGEIIWFKIYVVDDSSNKLLNLSKVAYIQLFDNTRSAVLQTKVALNDGVGSGSLFIPFAMHNGNYRFVAYTNWMKNFDAGYFFEQQLEIVNPLKAEQAQIVHPAQGYDVQFFPEGGHLVNGLAGKVAFKITGADGKGETCRGAVVNQLNDTITRFSTLKFGIGSFTFTPAGQAVYRAVIKTANGDLIKPLPQASENGFTLKVTDEQQNLDVAVQSNQNNTTPVIYVMAHSRHAIKFAAEGSIGNGHADFKIDKSKLEDGINYITLFDGNRRPLCERLVFKRPAKNMAIQATTDMQVYGTRKKVMLNISAADENNKPLSAGLSLSVFRPDSLQNADGDHIAAYLWLRAGLKGYIESPDYYFYNDNNDVNQQLDNLMLCQGWTAYDWDNTLSANKPDFKFLPEYDGPIITGHLVNTVKNQPATDIITYLTIPGTPGQLYAAKSDSAGQLTFNVKNFYGPKEIIAQTNYTRDSTYRIDINDPFTELRDTGYLPPLVLNEDIKNTLVGNSLNMQVQNIFSATSNKQFYDPLVDNDPFYGKPDQTYLLDDYTRFTTMEEVLREYVTSISVTSQKGKWAIGVIRNKQFLPDEPFALLDGKPLFDINKVFAVDPLKIKRLDLINQNYLYGPAIFNGILSFSSYKGENNIVELDPRAIVLDFEGLQLERKFYSPVYGTDEQLNSPVPDFRNTLYWQPDAGTGTDGKNTLQFYTGDKPGKYIGVIEGLSPNGEAGSGSFIFEVKK